MKDGPQIIVLTGAAGNIGSKLKRHWDGRHEVRPIDTDPRGDGAVLRADLSRPGAHWASAFDGAAAVVHLAANPDPVQSWDSARRNVSVDYHVLEAARKAGVPRFIYGSSNHVMGGYKDLDDPWTISTGLAPRPGTLWNHQGRPAASHNYALGKLCGEEMGRCCAAAHGLTAVAVRIGWVQLGENLPADVPENTDPWVRRMWLSNADLCRLFDCCLSAPVPTGKFVVVNGMSANRGMRWDLDSAQADVGYVARDGIG